MSNDQVIGWVLVFCLAGGGMGAFLYMGHLSDTIVWVDQGKVTAFSISQEHDCQLSDWEVDYCIQVSTGQHGLVWARTTDPRLNIGTQVFVSENGMGSICQSNNYGEHVYC